MALHRPISMLLLFILATLLSQVLAIPTITAKGSKFFTSDGDQFFIKGTHSLPFPHVLMLPY